jgi:hypothetical protein
VVLWPTNMVSAGPGGKALTAELPRRAVFVTVICFIKLALLRIAP